MVGRTGKFPRQTRQSAGYNLRPASANSSPVTCNLFSENGQAQVEFALSILFVLLLIFGIFEMIMLLYTYNVMADAAKEGVRYAIVLGSDTSNGTSASGSAFCSSGSLPAVYGRVCSYAQASFHDISNMQVTVNYLDGSNTPPDRVQVTVSYPYSPLLGFINWGTININAASEGRIVF